MRDRTVWKVVHRALLGAALVIGGASRAAAQPAPRDLSRATLEDLMNITVTTATRTPEGSAAAPARVDVVSSAQIERRGYRSLADLLEDLPDFKVDLGGDTDYPAELTVQGTRGTNRVVLLLDGIRISSPTNEPLPILANYPVHGARQVEIVYGPASALYGADAFSAVVNIITKDATEAAGLSTTTSFGQFGLFNQTASYGARLGPRASLFVAGQFLYDRQPDLSRYYPEQYGGMQAQRTGVFPTIFGPMTAAPVSTDYEAPLSARSLQATLRAGGLQVWFFENRAQASTAPAYTPDNAVYDGAAFNRNTLLVAAAAYTRTFGPVTSTSTLTMSRHELDPESGYRNVFSNLTRSYKYAFGSMAKAEEQVSWKPSAAMALTAGGTVERFDSIPQGADLNAPVASRDEPGTILGTGIPDEFVHLRYVNAGVYAQAQYATSPRVSWTAGARGDYNTRYGATFNPRVGLVTRQGRTTLKALYGTAYLAPSPYQAHSHYGAFYSVDGGRTFASEYWHLGNPDLKPQQKKTVELNVLQSVTPAVVVAASGFVSRFSNMIKETDADQAYAGFYHGWPVAYIDFPVNEGRETLYGATFALDWMRGLGPDRQLAAHAGLSLVDGRVREEDETGVRVPVGAMAPVQFRGSVDLDWGRWSVSPRVSIVGEQRVLAIETAAGGGPARRTLDGYATVDVNLRRRAIAGRLDAFLTLENAFDARYVNINARAYTNPEELIGAPQNPRRVTIGVSVRVP